MTKNWASLKLLIILLLGFGQVLDQPFFCLTYGDATRADKFEYLVLRDVIEEGENVCLISRLFNNYVIEAPVNDPGFVLFVARFYIEGLAAQRSRDFEQRNFVVHNLVVEVAENGHYFHNLPNLPDEFFYLFARLMLDNNRKARYPFPFRFRYCKALDVDAPTSKYNRDAV